MELDENDLLDILAYNSDKFLNEFAAIKDPSEQRKAIEKYLVQHCDKKVEVINDFPKDLDWFNVTEPIRLNELRGKIVILDFFTYCCINCMHILPDLKCIENSYPVENGLVVVGVHSAKFENEKDSANLLSAIQRYNVSHPIVNDFNSEMWAQLKIKCWPTLFIIAPNGSPLFVLMGEGYGHFLKIFVATCISFYKDRRELNFSSLPLNPSTDLISASNLRFPSKICCNFQVEEQCELIAVSDSGNNRVIILNSDGCVLHKVGGFESGFVDGDFTKARFNSPHGLTFLNDNELIIADTGNHAIRKINFIDKEVSTIAGTGQQGSDKIGGLVARKQELSSPWDVTIFRTKDMDMSFHMDEQSVQEKNVILIAMAGTHQIWGIFLDGIIWWKFKKYEPLTCIALIGNGSEENRNNSYPLNAAFAQPSGLTLFNDMLFVADSESSSIRKVSMIDGKVTAVVGGDRNPLNLFAFGDNDGKQFSAKLQHPLGVSYNLLDDYLYVADTYNHKIKRVDVKNNIIETCLIRESKNAELFQFSEPGGVCVNSTGDMIYVADTNNHNIQVVNLKTSCTSPLKLQFSSCKESCMKETHLETLEKIVKVNKKSKLTLNTTLICTGNVNLTEKAPQKWNLHLPCNDFHAEITSGQIIGGKCTVIVDIDHDESTEKNVDMHYSLNICCGAMCMRREFRTQIKLICDAGLDSDVVENLNIFVNSDSVGLH